MFGQIIINSEQKWKAKKCVVFSQLKLAPKFLREMTQKTKISIFIYFKMSVILKTLLFTKI